MLTDDKAIIELDPSRATGLSLIIDFSKVKFKDPQLMTSEEIEHSVDYYLNQINNNLKS